MARMARTQTSIGATNGGMPSVQTQRFNHAQSNIVGADQGLDPFRGDLTNAFNQFFGDVQQALQTQNNASWQIRQQEAQNIRNERRLEAEALARDTYMENPNMSAADIPGYVSSLSEEQSRSRTFMTTFRDTLGANIGDRMYGDFSIRMQSRNPANFEAEAQQYWEENYGNGTGDAYVDNAMSAAWSRNYERARVGAAQQAIANARAAAWENTVNGIYTTMREGFDQGDYATAFAAVRSQHPFESSGRTASRVLGVMSQAAVANGPAATQAFLAFLDQPPTNEDGTAGQSLSERFPAQIAQLRTATYDQLLRSTTLAGAEAVQQSGEALAGIIAEPDEFTRLEELTGYLTADIGTLMNTPGANYQGVMALRTRAQEAVAEAQQVVLTQNRIHAGVTRGQWHSGLTTQDIGDQGYDYLLRNADVINSADPAVAVRAGNSMRAMFDRAGSAVFTDEVRDYFAFGLMNPDPNMNARTFDALRTMDADRANPIIGELLAQHPEAMVRFNAMNTAPTVAGGALGAATAVASPEVLAASRMIADEGGPSGVLFAGEGTAAERQAAFSEQFHGSDMAERIQEALGQDTLFGGWGSPNLSPRVQQTINQVVEQEMALMRARGDGSEWRDVDALRERVAATMAPSLYTMNGTVWLRGEGPVVGDENNLNMVPLSNAARHPNTGEFENTVETLQGDIQGITDGFTGIGLDVENVLVRPADYLAAYNGYQLLDGATNRPLMIEVGSDYQIDREYTPEGEERYQIAVWWNGSDTVQFNGNAEHDQALMTQILPPGVNLLPHTDADGNVYAYEMFVAPRWQGTTRYTMAELQRRANGDIPLHEVPPEQRMSYLANRIGDGLRAASTEDVNAYLTDVASGNVERPIASLTPESAGTMLAFGQDRVLSSNENLAAQLTTYRETGQFDRNMLPQWARQMDDTMLAQTLTQTAEATMREAAAAQPQEADAPFGAEQMQTALDSYYENGTFDRNLLPSWARELDDDMLVSVLEQTLERRGN